MKITMITAFLFLIVCVGGSNQDNRYTKSPHILDMLQTLCPGTKVCSRKQTSNERSEQSALGTTSCCTECSCLPTCEDNGSCCFPNRTQQVEEQPFRNRLDCLFPSSVQPLVKDRFRYYSYSMVSDVPKTSTIEINSTSVCGDKNIAPWGSLYPVYSVKRKQIYKNSACANLDGVDDGKLWDAEILCKKPPDALGSDVSLFVLGLDSSSFSDVCQVNFIYQGNSEDIQNQKCYLDLVDTCHASDFPIPDGVSFSKKEIREACTSGLSSPYRGTTIYANVFCRICSAEGFRETATCPLFDRPARGSTYKGFTALLDTSFIKSIQKNIHGRITKYPEACRFQNSDGLRKMVCRRVFCPSGKLRDETGQCIHPNKIWYDKIYKVYIELTTEVKLDINDVFQLNSGSISYSLPALQTPWGNKWTVDSIYNEHTDENENRTKFVVILKKRLSKVYPNQFLKDIRSSVNRDWLLKHNNSTTILKSSFFKCAALYKHVTRPPRPNTFRCSALDKVGVTHFGNYSKNVSEPLFLIVYRTLDDTYGYTHTITKLYMCDQIELTENDFILSQNKKMLYNKITTTFMFDGEIELISWKTFEGLRARICINDSGFYRTNQATDSFGGLSFNIVCAIFVLNIQW